MKRKYIADLTAGEIEEALAAGARKFNAECIRLGISRVHEVDGVAVLTHPDGSRTPIPEDDEEAEKFLDRYKVSLRKDGKEFRSLEDLEIGDMAVQARWVGLPDAERQRLGWFRRVRNALAHNEVVSWETLTSPIAIRIMDFRE